MSTLKWFRVASYPEKAQFNRHSSHLSTQLSTIIGPFVITNNNYILFDATNVYKYDVDTNQWSVTTSTTWPWNSKITSTALDKQRRVLYCVYSTRISRIHLENYKTISDKCTDIKCVNRTSKSIILNNCLYFVGGNQNNSILKWDARNGAYSVIAAMYNADMLSDFGLIHYQKSNCLLLFGGYNHTNKHSTDSILEFDINTKKWTKLCVSLPKRMRNIQCSLVMNKYVLIFGESHIYVYCIKDKTIKTSKIECPFRASQGSFVSVVMNDKSGDEKIVFGYVRKEWRLSEISDHYFPPSYILGLMHLYYSKEYVYLLKTTTNEHYKLRTSDIVGSN